MNNGRNIPITAFKDFTCEQLVPSNNSGLSDTWVPVKCGGKIFTPVINLLSYKGFQSNGQLVIGQKPIGFKCDACGTVYDLKELKPMLS